MPSKDEIRAYWDQRAEASAGDAQATTDDVWMRELERRALDRELAGVLDAGASVVDIGCGDGSTVRLLAGRYPRATFRGIDYSEAMIDAARAALAQQPPAIAARVTFDVGDVTDLRAAVGTDRFDVALTDRCLINLPSVELQARAIDAIATIVRPGGRYVAIENFLDGQDALNDARAAVGLAPIAIRWHNRFLDEAAFVAACRRHFCDVEVVDFSSTYYLVTRVAYSALCAFDGTTPDYDHPLHRIAVEMPAVGRCSPIRLVRMVRSGDAAEVAAG